MIILIQILQTGILGEWARGKSSSWPAFVRDRTRYDRALEPAELHLAAAAIGRGIQVTVRGTRRVKVYGGDKEEPPLKLKLLSDGRYEAAFVL